MPPPLDLSDIVIRKAKPEDFPKILELHELTFYEHKEREPEFDEKAPFAEKHLKRWSIGLSKAAIITHHILVAKCCGHVAGYTITTRYRHYIRRVGQPNIMSMISDISIAPEWRGKGLGKHLLQATEANETKRQCKLLMATVWPQNTASNRLFQNAHFEEPTGDVENIFAPRICYRKALRPSVYREFLTFILNLCFIVVSFGFIWALVFFFLK